jgi:hypothetical protein
MKTEWRLFGLVSGFLFAAAALYAWWSYEYFNGHGSNLAPPPGRAGHEVEWVGVIGLILAGLLCLMCGGYFWFVSTRIDLRPEDRADAEIVEGAGEIGFFSPGSYWPFGIALSALITAVAIAYWQPWLLIVGLIFTVLGASALIFEYYTGARRAAEH